MKDIRSTVMQLSGRWGNTCYATLCLAVEAALDLPYGDVQMKHLWSAIHERTGKSPQAISRALARAAADVWERGNRELLEALEATGWAFWIHWLTPLQVELIEKYLGEP